MILLFSIPQFVLIYGSAFVIVVLLGIILRAFYSSSVKSKLHEYQREIAKSHSKILKLEVTNEKLQHRVNELETNLQRPKIA